VSAARLRASPAGGADVALRGVAARFSLLLLATPVNTLEAWCEFEASGCSRQPRFRYASIDLDLPELLARLDAVDLSDVDDPDLSTLLRDETAAIRTRLEMIRGRGTPRFLAGSVALHGTVDDGLLARARAILRALEPAPAERPPEADVVDAVAFRDLALAEIDHYRRASGVDYGGCRIDADVSGPVVVHGELRIPPHFLAAPARVDAIIAHEIGTHVVTFLNATAQPLHLLEGGLPGSDALQEGLAVIGEYLVGGLSAERMRAIAARVIAVHAMSSGASFVEVHRTLRQEAGLSPYTAFFLAMRVCRAGGFTKDAAYLRGLVALLAFYRRGEPDDVLFTGKLGLEHIDAVRRLVARGVLRPPLVRPRHFVEAAYAPRLRALREGLDVVDLMDAKGLP
jgi:uncharacterized protein (TIGR02421 family)